jgi:glycosyltransferase involved in cell wall biosynthesis
MKDFILLIPYYNDIEGLTVSLKSVVYQPDKFDILIVDDGSRIKLDETALQNLLPGVTIKILSLNENKGVAVALNTGLKELNKRTDFKYIARLDCGDTSSPNRFTEQVKFLDKYTDIYLLGSWCQFTDTTTGKSYLYKTKTEHTDIIKEMHFKCSFIHPTVMFRREVLDTVGYYPENYPHAEDYAYFWKIIRQFKGALLPEVLVNVTTNMQAISAKNYKVQVKSRIAVIKDFGTNKLLIICGVIGATLRRIVPYRLIMKTKLLLKIIN